MSAKIYDLDDPVIVKLSQYTLTKRENRREVLPEFLHNRPIYVNSTFSEFKEKYNTLSMDEAYSILNQPVITNNKNLTIEEPCLETVSS